MRAGEEWPCQVWVGNLRLLEQLGGGIFVGPVILMYMPACMSHWTSVVDVNELLNYPLMFYVFKDLCVFKTATNVELRDRTYFQPDTVPDTLCTLNPMK